jgi:lysophosphatidate acyltransferase
MLSIFLLGINSLKSTFPIIALFGSAPTFFTFWILLRTITLTFCSRQIYRKYDDYFYSIYQRFILFFFQNWPNVKIYLHGDYQRIFEKKENILYLSNHQSSGD